MLSICVIATGRNCQDLVYPFYQSLMTQSDQDFGLVWVDDASDDMTRKMMFACGIPNVIQVVHRNGAYLCRDSAIEFAQTDIIVMADLDDELLPTAIERIRAEHEDGKLMTYGTYIDHDGFVFSDLHYPDHIHETRDYRKDKWRCTHLRSFRRELYMRIPKWELTQSEIDSYPDAEILFSMMEMCGKDRIGVITEPIYRFNNLNPNSTLRVYGKDQEGYDEICNRPKRDLI